MNSFRLSLASDEVGLVGYGSLISRVSLEKTLGRPYSGPFLECLIPGWRRQWNVAMPNSTYYAAANERRYYPKQILYLNVCKCRDSMLNGILFVIHNRELSLFDEREYIYDRVEITNCISNGEIANGSAFIYTGKPQFCFDSPSVEASFAIRSTYLAIVDAGLKGQSPEFRKRYEQSSDEPLVELVIDDKRD